MSSIKLCGYVTQKGTCETPVWVGQGYCGAHTRFVAAKLKRAANKILEKAEKEREQERLRLIQLEEEKIDAVQKWLSKKP